MYGVTLALAAAVVILVVWQIVQSAQTRRKDEESRGLTGQFQRDLQALAGQTQAIGQQVGQMGQNVAQRMESVTQALQKGVTDSAQIAAQAQLGEFQEAGRGMSQATQVLQDILGGAKSRGSLGEVTLERLLEDSLPSAQYSMQYRFSSGEIADAAVFLRDGKRLAIDSKFPLDTYRRIAAEGDDARRAFATAVKGHADSIAKKYIVPDEGTLDFALMFVPSESVYYELLMTADSKGQPVDAFCRERKVLPVSPNTLYAHLCVIAMGLRGMQIEENAKRLGAGLSGMHKQLEKFADVFEKLGTHLKNAQQSYTEADKQFERSRNALGGLLEPAVEAEANSASTERALPPAKSANSGA
jgi:DNA recombination protein RmuC